MVKNPPLTGGKTATKLFPVIIRAASLLAAFAHPGT